MHLSIYLNTFTYFNNFAFYFFAENIFSFQIFRGKLFHFPKNSHLLIGHSIWIAFFLKNWIVREFSNTTPFSIIHHIFYCSIKSKNDENSLMK